MAKLVIGKALKTFPMEVEIPTPTGSDTVNFTAKHLTAVAWAEKREANSETIKATIAAMFDTARKAAEKEFAAEAKKPKKQAGDTSEDDEAAIVALVKPVKESDIKRFTNKATATMIAQIAEGWDLDEEFNAANLEAMCDLYQGAHIAVFDKYNELLEARRLGNS